jgi:hypothetical protein
VRHAPQCTGPDRASIGLVERHPEVPAFIVGAVRSCRR